MEPTREGTRRTTIDGVGCVSFLVLAMLLVSALGMLTNRADSAGQIGGGAPPASRARETATEAAPQIVLNSPVPATFTMVPTLAAGASPTAPPPATATIPSTATPTALPSATPSPTWTATPLPLPTPAGTLSFTVRAPMLMYHYVSDPPEEADEYRLDLSVSPTDFRVQMQYLAENGYTTIDLYDLSLAIAGKKRLPPKPVILTFDDGYRDHYENAFPILQEFGFVGIFFVITELVDDGNPNHLTWPMVEEMAAAGMRIESHSRTHPDLRDQPRDVLLWQIRGSQETLAAHIGYAPRYFCYPGGRYDEDTIAMLRELDFWGAVTTASGKWHGFDERYEWRRLRIRSATALAEFVDMVAPLE